MLQRPLDTLTAADIEALVANGVSESRDLDFKLSLPGGADGDIKEFLADVTALANTQGGDLIFGVEESSGVATAVPGVSSADPDRDILRLENLVRDGVEPRLSGVHLVWVPLKCGRGVVVLRVPAGLAAPHRVKFKNSGRFYARNSAGKYELDTHELRLAFTASEDLPRRLRGLHQDAVASAKGSEMPFRIHAEPTAVVTVAPIGFFRELRDLDITPEIALAPVKPSGHLDWMYTMEGVLMHTPLNEPYSPTDNFNSVRSYALTHRRGRTDAAWTIGGVQEFRPGLQRSLIWPTRFESGLVDVMTSSTAKLGGLGVQGPWIMFATVFGVSGFELVLDQHSASVPAWRDGATLPEVVADNLSAATIVPILKAFWLLFGVPRPDVPPMT